VGLKLIESFHSDFGTLALITLLSWRTRSMHPLSLEVGSAHRDS
jgi:hypothetical protein